MKETVQKLTDWSSTCSKAVDDYLDLTAPYLLGNPMIDPQLQWLLKQLAISCNMTTESTLLLISHIRLWDAEILLRTVMEGTFKFAFLCIGDENDRRIKANEYWEDLPESTQIKDQQRIEEFLAKLDDPQADEWRPLRDRLVKPKDFQALQAKYPRKVRKQLEQKWSFFEIAQAISKSNIPGFDALNAMMYGYGMASHLVHQDADGIGIIWDRRRREQERRDSVELAHGVREISDLLLMAMLRATSTFKLHSADTKPVRELFDKHKIFLNEMGEATTAWHKIEYSNASPPAT